MNASQIGKFVECAGDLSYVQIVCAAAFVSLNNSSIVSFCCFTKISRLEPRLKFKVRGRVIGRTRQTFQSGMQVFKVYLNYNISKQYNCIISLYCMRRNVCGFQPELGSWQ